MHEARPLPRRPAGLAGCILPPSRIAVRGVPKFHRVNAGLYRSAQPDAAGIQALAAQDVKTIINLRMADEAWAGEAAVARSHGIGHLNIPLRGLSGPTAAEAAKVLAAIASSPAPVFTHCRRGADRTGTMIACYRIEHDGGTPQAAQREATEHGRRWVQIGMRYFITRFAARATPLPGIHRVEPSGAGLILRLEPDCQHADPRRLLRTRQRPSRRWCFFSCVAPSLCDSLSALFHR